MIETQSTHEYTQNTWIQDGFWYTTQILYDTHKIWDGRARLGVKL